MSKHRFVPKRRLSLLDRLRGWHWEDRMVLFSYLDLHVPQKVKVRNWCGCVI